MDILIEDATLVPMRDQPLDLARLAATFQLIPDEEHMRICGQRA